MKSSCGSWWMFFWKGKSIVPAPRTAMKRLLLDHADALPGHALAQPLLDLGVLEVEEVPRVVPDEAVLLDRLAPAADLAVGLEDEVVVVAAVGSAAAVARPVTPAPTMSVRTDSMGTGRGA